MPSLIEQIQSDALDRSVSVADLLRRVKLAAAKLGLDDTLEWVSLELGGYMETDTGEMPPYRVASGNLVVRTRFHGTVAAHGDPQSIAALSVHFFREPIGAIEALIQGEGDRIACPLNLEMAKFLSDYGNNGTYEIHLSKGALHAITDHVRNLVLDWAIKLEKEGILGEGMAFSHAEKERAEIANQGIQINNYGYLQQGDNHGDQSRVNINSSDSSENNASADIFTQVHDAVARDIDEEDVCRELQSLIAEMRQQQGTQQYRDIYTRFMARAADHIAVVTPFLPALAAYIPS